MKGLLDPTVMKQIEYSYHNGYEKCLMDLGEIKPFVSKREACRIFGEKNVNNWIEWGLLEVVKDQERNSKCRLDRARLLLLAASDQRCEYFRNKETMIRINKRR